MPQRPDKPRVGQNLSFERLPFRMSVHALLSVNCQEAKVAALRAVPAHNVLRSRGLR